MLVRRYGIRCCLVIFATFITGLAAASGADARPDPAQVGWPQWRGPHRDGVSTETGLSHDWSQKAPPLVWKATGLGEGYSSVSIAAGIIYTMGDREDNQYVIALSQKDGQELWCTRIGKSWQGGGYAGPRSTPTIDGKMLYAIGPHGDLLCLDAKTGQPQWQKNFKADFNGLMMSHWGFSESPLVDGERLICTPGGKDAAIVALDKRTGQEIWRSHLPASEGSKREGAGYSSIVVSEGAGVRRSVQLTGAGWSACGPPTARFYGRTSASRTRRPTFPRRSSKAITSSHRPAIRQGAYC